MKANAALVGRDEELQALLEAAKGGAPLIVVYGDARLGKSALVGASLPVLQAEGVTVTTGHCVPLTGQLPLLPFVEAFKGLGRDGQAMADAVPSSLRPTLSGLLPGAGPAPVGDDVAPEAGPSERQRLFLAVGELLSPPARTKPVVIVIEDLHWADASTVDLLAHLVVRLPRGVTMLVTVRTDEEPFPSHVRDALAELQRVESTRAIRLTPLSLAEVAELAERALGRFPADSFVRRLREVGGGNPFFTVQLCQQPGFALDSQEARIPLPPPLGDFLQARIGRLSRAARRVLLVLGVAASPLSLKQLSAAVGMERSDLADAVSELSASGMLAPTNEDRVGMRHALLGTAVIRASDPGALVTAHARIAAVLDAAHDPSLAVASAGHWREAGQRAEELGAILVAAPVAEQLADYAVAADLWLRAFELVTDPDRDDTSATPNPCDVAVAAIKDLERTGRPEEAFDVAEAAYRVTAACHSSASLGSLLRWVGHLRAIHDADQGAEVLEQAVDILSGHPAGKDLVAALVRLGRIQCAKGRIDDGVTTLEAALAAANECGAPSSRAVAAVGLKHALLELGEPERAAAVIDGLAQDPEILADPRARGVLAVSESDYLLRGRHVELAVPMALEALRSLREIGYGSSWDATILEANACEALLELGHTSQAADVLGGVEDPRARSAYESAVDMQWALIDLNRNAVTDALARVDRAMSVASSQEDPEQLRLAATAAAQVHVWARQPARALTVIEESTAALQGTNQAPRTAELFVLGARSAADLIAASTARADDEQCEQTQQRLARLVRAVTNASHPPFTPLLSEGCEEAFGLQWSAEISRARNDPDPTAWSAAAGAWVEQRRPHREAYCRWRACQARVAQGGHRAEIATDLQNAFELSTQMIPLRQAVVDLAGRLHIRLTTKPPAPAAEARLRVALTPREHEILGYLVAGRSNGQIAKDLFISDKTVSTHVSNLLRKIGVADRVQAAAWAEEAGAFPATSTSAEKES